MGYWNNRMPRTKEEAARYLAPAGLPPLVREEIIRGLMDSNLDEESIISKAQTNFVARRIDDYIKYLGMILTNHKVEWNVETFDMSIVNAMDKIHRPDGPLRNYTMDDGDIIKHMRIRFPKDIVSSRCYRMLVARLERTNIPGMPNCAWFDEDTQEVRFQLLPSTTLNYIELLYNIIAWCYTIYPHMKGTPRE